MFLWRKCLFFDKKDEKIAYFSKKKFEMFGGLQKTPYLCTAFERKRYHNKVLKLESDLENAEIAQLVEHNLAKVGVAGPSPVFRSISIETEKEH